MLLVLCLLQSCKLVYLVMYWWHLYLCSSLSFPDSCFLHGSFRTASPQCISLGQVCIWCASSTGVSLYNMLQPLRQHGHIFTEYCHLWLMISNSTYLPHKDVVVELSCQCSIPGVSHSMLLYCHLVLDNVYCQMQLDAILHCQVFCYTCNFVYPSAVIIWLQGWYQMHQSLGLGVQPHKTSVMHLSWQTSLLCCTDLGTFYSMCNLSLLIWVFVVVYIPLQSLT